VVNAVSADTGLPLELVILSDTAELMIVSRDDVILDGTFVDLDNNVFDSFGDPRGFITFAEDGDGFRTVWWLSLDGSVVELDPFTAEIFAGTTFPEDWIDVPCDACRFVDFPPAGVCDDATPPVVVNICGNGVGSAGMLAMMFCGLAGLRLMRWRCDQLRLPYVKERSPRSHV
jgi:hypothetical protein